MDLLCTGFWFYGPVVYWLLDLWTCCVLASGSMDLLCTGFWLYEAVVYWLHALLTCCALEAARLDIPEVVGMATLIDWWWQCRGPPTSASAACGRRDSVPPAGGSQCRACLTQEAPRLPTPPTMDPGTPSLPSCNATTTPERDNRINE
ncbi:uncharacterized protein LOC121877973 [Homarus americanus]|uniref:uncharacterized protein LOC121877973 n=1 Tax=Homarus americanus TaxID=6706 RepID=UPI001C442A5B|nr:uncharacterized protein LOC121877973 [Homarus americanus]